MIDRLHVIQSDQPTARIELHEHVRVIASANGETLKDRKIEIATEGDELHIRAVLVAMETLYGRTRRK